VYNGNEDCSGEGVTPSLVLFQGQDEEQRLRSLFLIEWKGKRGRPLDWGYAFQHTITA